MTIDELLAKAMGAVASIDNASETIASIHDELRKGVSLPAGRAIIKSIFGEGHESKRLLAQLVTYDPNANASLIKWANLPESLVEKFFGRTDAAQSFLFDADEFISRAMGKVLHNISETSANDTGKAELYNEFRKRTLFFIWGMNNCLGIPFEDLCEAKCWSDLPVAQHIEDDGDYLFITDFLPTLKEAFTELLKKHVSSDIDMDNKSRTGIADMDYSLERYKSDVLVVKLYATYINNFLEVTGE